MRKISNLIVPLLVLALALSGCGKVSQKENGGQVAEASETNKVQEPKPDSGSDPASEPEESPTENKTEASQEMKNLEICYLTEGDSFDGGPNQFGVGYARRDYVEISRETKDRYPNLAATLDELNEARRNQYSSVLKKFAASARKYANSISDHFSLYENRSCIDKQDAKVLRADESLLSFVIRKYTFWGDVESDKFASYTYDTVSGQALSLDDFITNESAFQKAVFDEYSRKYGNTGQALSYNRDSLIWGVTANGIRVIFPDGDGNIETDDSRSVDLAFADYQDAVSSKYSAGPVEYVIPFGADGTLCADVNGDGLQEVLAFRPVAPKGAEDSGEYSTYELLVDGKKYDGFPEYWFYSYSPYLVHKRDGNYLYIQLECYDGNLFSVHRFENVKPVKGRNLNEDALQYETEPADSEYSYSSRAFTDPGIFGVEVDFADKLVGYYKSDEGDESDDSEVYECEIYEIDGRLFFEYLGDFNYGAAEIQLLDSKPLVEGKETVYKTRMYAFSGFSFGGDYWGAGDEVTVYVNPNGIVTLSEGNPFWGKERKLYRTFGSHLHTVQGSKVENTTEPGILGTWRQTATYDGTYCEIFYDFHKDGTVEIISKAEGYVPTVLLAVYDLKDGYIDAERMGYAAQPVGPFRLSMGADGVPVITNDYNDQNPFAGDGEESEELHRTVSGSWDYDMDLGPAGRTDEVKANRTGYLGAEDPT